MAEEEERWNKAVATYEDFIGELKTELNAVDRVIEVFSSANIKDDMLEKIDWWSRVQETVNMIYLFHDAFKKMNILHFLKN